MGDFLKVVDVVVGVIVGVVVGTSTVIEGVVAAGGWLAWYCLTISPIWDWVKPPRNMFCLAKAPALICFSFFVNGFFGISLPSSL